MIGAGRRSAPLSATGDKRRSTWLGDAARGVPSAAAWLGGLGAVPFVLLAGAGPFLDSGPRADAAFFLAAYGAVILSFIGGIRWGLAIAPAAARPEGHGLARRLLTSVFPSLLSWAAVLLPPAPGLALLAAGFAVMLASDLRASAKGEAPSWYPSLRVPLSIVVIVSIGFALFWML